jgi:dienelactone hydrolase
MARRCAVSCRLMVACRRNCPAVAGRVKAKILVCHGNDDPFVPAGHVSSLITELTETGADWQLINYGGTVHSFTNPEADSRGLPALKCNKLSDESYAGSFRRDPCLSGCHAI